jgi:hypothetical protein
MKIKITWFDRPTPDSYFVKSVCRDGSFLMTKRVEAARNFVSDDAARACVMALERRPGKKIVTVIS